MTERKLKLVPNPGFDNGPEGGAIVVLNEQHSLLPQQEALLQEEFGEWATWPLPSSGLSEEEVFSTATRLVENAAQGGRAIVFLSPVAALVKQVLLTAIHLAVLEDTEFGQEFDWADVVPVMVFFNDRREAVERDGRIIHRLHPDGWKLV